MDLLVGWILAIYLGYANGPALRLPHRPTNAIGGAAFAKQIEGLAPEAREDRMFQEIAHGNIPDFMRHMVSVPLTSEIDGQTVVAHIFVTPDYMAIGSNTDYFFVPMTPYTAQRIADLTRCTLPTPKMVDAIYSAAPVKLTPSPIPPTPAMTTVSVFETHNQIVHNQREATLASDPLGSLVAGDKKDIVICKGLADAPGHVAIYGWHTAPDRPIQPLYLGHLATWADYSHGVRLVSNVMDVNGKPADIHKVLEDPKLSALLSSEGPIPSSRYRFSVFPHPDDPAIRLPSDERLESFSPVEGVRVVIDEPAVLRQKVRLVIYALPNGNTIEQSFGRKLRPDDDWHYNIQHIGAQTRFLRALDKDESLVVAYVEARNHAWPAWLRANDKASTVQIVNAIVKRFPGQDLRVTLDSHSGGGAFTFDYIDSVDKIPAQIDRIAFLDSEYNYDASLHEAKLAGWLRSDGHYLCLIAYDDASARLNGKPFVSAEGGTWGRTHAMLADLGHDFKIVRTNSTDPERYEGLEGRIVLWLKENPRAEIFHTVQVERNGFIESLLSGTADAGKGYAYFGPRAYSKYIR